MNNFQQYHTQQEPLLQLNLPLCHGMWNSSALSVKHGAGISSNRAETWV